MHAKGSRVVSVGPVASSSPGAGKIIVSAICIYAEELGFSTLVRGGGFVCNALTFWVSLLQRLLKCLDDSCLNIS